MKNINIKSSIIKFMLYILLIFSLLFFIKTYFSYSESKTVNNSDTIYKNLLEDTTEKYYYKVYYPKFNNPVINETIKNYIYPKVKKFKRETKKHTNQQSLIINYELYFKNNYVNIFFNIKNSIEPKDIAKSITIDLNTYEVVTIDKIFDENYLKNNILESVFKKYNTEIYNEVTKDTIKGFNYKISEKSITVFLESEDNYDYSINVNIPLTNDNEKSTEIDKTKKMVALTFDDGPSLYTKQIVDCLKSNSARATFFMIGTQMSKNIEIVKYVYENNMEVGSHTYSHKDLTLLTKSQMENEINSVSILYNSITNVYISYLRPPYGNYNNTIKSISPYPIITWSIDPKDWMNKDATNIYNHVIKRVEDGSIIILHDIYPSTVEGIKLIVPQLKSMDYEIVTISELSEYKQINLTPGEVYREIK